MLAAACRAEIGDVGTHGLKNGQAVVKIRLAAACQNGQRSGSGTAVTSGNGSVQHPQAPLCAFLTDPTGQRGAGGGHIDYNAAPGGAVQNVAGGEIDLLHILRKAHHGDNDLTGLDTFGNAAVKNSAIRCKVCRLFRAAGIDVNFIAGFHQVPRHGSAHDAHADPTYFLHEGSLLFYFLQHGTNLNPCQGKGRKAHGPQAAKEGGRHGRTAGKIRKTTKKSENQGARIHIFNIDV